MACVKRSNGNGWGSEWRGLGEPIPNSWHDNRTRIVQSGNAAGAAAGEARQGELARKDTDIQTDPAHLKSTNHAAVGVPFHLDLFHCAAPFAMPLPPSPSPLPFPLPPLGGSTARNLRLWILLARNDSTESIQQFYFFPLSVFLFTYRHIYTTNKYFRRAGFMKLFQHV